MLTYTAVRGRQASSAGDPADGLCEVTVGPVDTETHRDCEQAANTGRKRNDSAKLLATNFRPLSHACVRVLKLRDPACYGVSQLQRTHGRYVPMTRNAFVRKTAAALD